MYNIVKLSDALPALINSCGFVLYTRFALAVGFVVKSESSISFLAIVAVIFSEAKSLWLASPITL